MKFYIIAAASAATLNNQQKLYQMMEMDDDSFVQTGKVIESAPTWRGWGPNMNEFPGTVNELGDWMSPYTRKIPEHFVGDAAQEGVPPVDKFT